MPSEVEIRTLVRRQLRELLKSDLDGGEDLMKEVWEQCATVSDVAVAKREIAEIIAYLSLPVAAIALDVEELRAAFADARRRASRTARWPVEDPGAEPNTCRYCGQRWQCWPGSQLDGHAACIVPEDFKRYVGDLLRSSPAVGYAVIARAVGVSESVVRSWAYSAGVAGPLSHRLRTRRPNCT